MVCYVLNYLWGGDLIIRKSCIHSKPNITNKKYVFKFDGISLSIEGQPNKISKPHHTDETKVIIHKVAIKAIILNLFFFNSKVDLQYGQLKGLKNLSSSSSI